VLQNFKIYLFYKKRTKYSILLSRKLHKNSKNYTKNWLIIVWFSLFLMRLGWQLSVTCTCIFFGVNKNDFILLISIYKIMNNVMESKNREVVSRRLGEIEANERVEKFSRESFFSQESFRGNIRNNENCTFVFQVCLTFLRTFWMRFLVGKFHTMNKQK
jgi:DNA-binding phage protein